MDKREKWAMLLAVTAFVAAYLICCYIPAWRIKLAADPLTYFAESLRHMMTLKLGIATVALIDTDCDPDLVDLPIPGNDDSMRSIELIVKMLSDAVVAGKTKQAVRSKFQQHAGEDD